MKKLNEQFKDLRLSKGVSANLLSQLTNISTPAITRWEKGKMNLSIDKVELLLGALGADLRIIEWKNIQHSEKELMRLVHGGVPNDYVELRFLNEYMRCKKLGSKRRIVKKYASFPTTTDVDGLKEPRVL